jgi:membrane fusion protein (multidrug efflux system)
LQQINFSWRTNLVIIFPLQNAQKSLEKTMLYKRLKSLYINYKKTHIIIAVIILMTIFYGLYKAIHTSTPPQNLKVVEVQIAQLRPIQQTARFIGTIRSEQATTLVAKSNGILDRFVTSGQHVKKGDLIAKIDNNDIERNYKLSQEMEQISKLQYDRFNQLQKTGVISQSTLEEKKGILIESQKKVTDAKMAIDEINVYAPFDGIVGIFKIREGSQVQAGDTLVSFYDPSKTIVEFDVPLSVMSTVNDGDTVFIEGKQYPLTYIQKMLDEETHMSPAYVNIECNNCIIGSTVDVNLVVKEKKSAIIIPNEAVFLRNGKPFVYIVKDGKATLTPVEPGIREKEWIEITSGLQQNDQVIISGQARLYPEAPVKITQENSKDSQAKQ